MIIESEVRVGNYYEHFHAKDLPSIYFQWAEESWGMLRDKGGSLDEFEPVIITKNWLRALGFHLIDTDLPSNWTVYQNGNFFININNTEPTIIPCIEKTHYPGIHYVHEIQNLYFQHTQKELNS
jgi:hypothetical protein